MITINVNITVQIPEVETVPGLPTTPAKQKKKSNSSTCNIA
jgi:hypothetical protein